MTKFAAKLSTTALAGMFATGILLIAVGSEDVPAVVSQAIAAPTFAAETTGVAYFPSLFPTPDAAPTPHIEAF